MRVTKLVDILEIKDLAPFHFHIDTKYKMFASCYVLTKEEAYDLVNNIATNKKNYDDSKLGVCLADVTIYEFYELGKQIEDVEKFKDDISYLFSVNDDNISLIYSIFTILHEVGHWLYFKSSGKKSLEYCKWETEERREANELMNQSYNSPDKLLLKQAARDKYKNVPSEIESDKYAFNNIKEKLELVRKYINKSE